MNESWPSAESWHQQKRTRNHQPTINEESDPDETNPTAHEAALEDALSLAQEMQQHID
jgi:hypothetical protein